MQNYTKSFHRKSKNGKISTYAVCLLNVFILKRAFFYSRLHLFSFFYASKIPPARRLMGTGRDKNASITCVRGNAEKDADNAVFDESDVI